MHEVILKFAKVESGQVFLAVARFYQPKWSKLIWACDLSSSCILSEMLEFHLKQAMYQFVKWLVAMVG